MDSNTILILLTGLLLVLLFGYGFYRFFHYSDRYRLADWGGRFENHCAAFVSWFVHRYHGLSMQPIPLPESGPAIVVSNHISGLDPLALVAAAPRPLRFLIAREEYERFGLRWLFRLAGCIPVERDKRPELAMRAAMRAIAEGEVVALFPHAKIHLPSDPPVKIKGGAIRLSQLTGAAVYPVHVEGVRGEGHTLPAIVLKSKVKLTTHSPQTFPENNLADNIQKLQELIETPAYIKDQ